MSDTANTPAAPAEPAGSSAAAIFDRIYAPVERAAAEKLKDRTIEAGNLAALTRMAFGTIEAIGELTVGVALELAALETRIKAIERRLADVEQRAFQYGGTWKSGQTYEANTLVTFDGSLWVAIEATSTRPGAGPTPWRLAVKRGKDGRDART